MQMNATHSKKKQVNTLSSNGGVAFGRVPSLDTVYCFLFNIIACQIFVSSWRVLTMAHMGTDESSFNTILISVLELLGEQTTS